MLPRFKHRCMEFFYTLLYSPYGGISASFALNLWNVLAINTLAPQLKAFVCQCQLYIEETLNEQQTS